MDKHFAAGRDEEGFVVGGGCSKAEIKLTYCQLPLESHVLSDMCPIFCLISDYRIHSAGFGIEVSAPLSTQIRV